MAIGIERIDVARLKKVMKYGIRNRTVSLFLSIFISFQNIAQCMLNGPRPKRGAYEFAVRHLNGNINCYDGKHKSFTRMTKLRFYSLKIEKCRKNLSVSYTYLNCYGGKHKSFTRMTELCFDYLKLKNC